MTPLKIKVLNKFGIAEPLRSPDDIEAIFPYEQGTMSKKMSYGHIRVTNDSKGELEIDLNSFDVQGMSVGDNQNFAVKLTIGEKVKTAMFERSLHVKTELVDGEERKVLYKK